MADCGIPDRLVILGLALYIFREAGGSGIGVSAAAADRQRTAVSRNDNRAV